MDASKSKMAASTKWIDHLMIETALKKHRSCEAVTVESMSIEPACKSGAGYASQMFRLKVTFRVGEGGEVEQQSLIVKADHDRGAIKELAEELEAFDTESLILGEVMPIAHEALCRVELTHAASPARDLVYFLFANAGIDAHQRLPSLLETYHTQLQASLRALGMAAAADAYPLEELLRDLEDLQPFALFASTFSGFVHSWERVGDKFSRALQDLSLTPDLLDGVYDNDFSQPYTKYLIRHFESKGLL